MPMSLRSLNFLIWNRLSSQRVAGYVLAVFMLQVVAAGFCVPMASAQSAAMEKHQLSEASHCMQSAMSQQMSHDREHEATTHVCTHCDLPDLAMALDKHVQVMDSGIALLWFVAVVPSVQTIAVTHFQNLSPPLRTSFFTFDLNQRFRV